MEAVNADNSVSALEPAFRSPCLVREKCQFQLPQVILKKKQMFVQTKKINQEERMINSALLGLSLRFISSSPVIHCFLS